jgi:hypothetical protein
MLGWSHTRFPAVKLVLAAVALALSFPVLARADSFTFSNSGGSIKLSGGSFDLTNSSISELNNSPVTGYALSFATSKVFLGSLETGGSWAGGGSLTIKDSGAVIFSGTFSGTVTWTLESLATCTKCEYQLSGPLSGTYYPDGEGSGPAITIVTGSTTQIDLTTNNSGLYTGKNGLSDKGGTTNLVTPIPEPGSLALMGTGVLSLAFVLKRKIKGV